MDKFLHVRIESELKQQFDNVAKEKGLKPSQLIRQLMKQVVEENQD